MPVLTFHTLGGAPGLTAFPETRFEAILDRLCRRGTAISLDRVGEWLAGGQAPRRGSFVLTFDDAHRSIYERAVPLLLERGLTATLFVVSGGPAASTAVERLPPVEGRDSMRWSELRELAAAGFEIGAHSVSHRALPGLSRRAVESELRDSRRVLEEALGAPVCHFAYPRGAMDARCRSLAREIYRTASSDRLGMVTQRSARDALERIEMFYFRGLLEPLAGGPAWSWALRALAVPRRLRRTFAGAPR